MPRQKPVKHSRRWLFTVGAAAVAGAALYMSGRLSPEIYPRDASREYRPEDLTWENARQNSNEQFRSAYLQKLAREPRVAFPDTVPVIYDPAFAKAKLFLMDEMRKHPTKAAEIGVLLQEVDAVHVVNESYQPGNRAGSMFNVRSEEGGRRLYVHRVLFSLSDVVSEEDVLFLLYHERCHMDSGDISPFMAGLERTGVPLADAQQILTQLRERRTFEETRCHYAQVQAALSGQFVVSNERYQQERINYSVNYYRARTQLITGDNPHSRVARHALGTFADPETLPAQRGR